MVILVEFCFKTKLETKPFVELALELFFRPQSRENSH
jgi:hypothetical protein